MKEFYLPKRFQARTLVLLEHAEAIIAEYVEHGLSITLRQLYYQFVARGLLPNDQKSYKNLGERISDARLAGLIDWKAIEDRTRRLVGNLHYDDPETAIDAMANGYGIDKWSDQKYRVEVWVEKEALAGVIEQICTKLDVDWFACRGFVSQSEQYKAGKRFLHRAVREDQEAIVLHLGDHDPSGIDMTRDNLKRLEMFSGHNVTLLRIALNMDQIRQYNPPPNPAKVTDSRYAGYLADYGEESWELDALDPLVLQALIEKHVTEYRDEKKFKALQEKQERERQEFVALGEYWGEVPGWIENGQRIDNALFEIEEGMQNAHQRATEYQPSIDEAVQRIQATGQHMKTLHRRA